MFIPSLPVDKVLRNVHLDFSQAGEVGEGLAHQQCLDVAVLTLIKATQGPDGTVGQALERDFSTLSHKSHRPAVLLRPFLEILKRIGEELKVIELGIQDAREHLSHLRSR